MTISDQTEARLQNAALVLGACVLSCLAAVGTIVALVSFFMLCDENCHGRSWELIWQLVAASGGLFAAIAMTTLVVMRSPRAAGSALLVAVFLYAVWAVLLDAATHGWGAGPVPL